METGKDVSLNERTARLDAARRRDEAETDGRRKALLFCYPKKNKQGIAMEGTTFA